MEDTVFFCKVTYKETGALHSGFILPKGQPNVSLLKANAKKGVDNWPKTIATKGPLVYVIRGAIIASADLVWDDAGLHYPASTVWDEIKSGETDLAGLVEIEDHCMKLGGELSHDHLAKKKKQ